MRDQFAGDISDLLKFALLRTLAANDKRLGIGWYFVPGDNGRPDGRHREFCTATTWKNLDEAVWKALVDLPKRSVEALEELPFWPSGTIFHRNPILIGKQRESWFEEMKNRLAECDLVFLDPDNGLGSSSKKHARVKEIRIMRKDGRVVILIKFPAFIPHKEQIANYHRQLMKEAGAKSVFTITTSVRMAGTPRSRWFTIIDGEGVVEVRATKFADTLRQIPGCKVHCFNGDLLDNSFAVVDSSIEAGPGRKSCPECDRLFKGNGYGGMDAHWKANHELIMPYSTAWPLIKSGKYSRGRE